MHSTHQEERVEENEHTFQAATQAHIDRTRRGRSKFVWKDSRAAAADWVWGDTGSASKCNSGVSESRELMEMNR